MTKVNEVAWSPTFSLPGRSKNGKNCEKNTKNSQIITVTSIPIVESGCVEGKKGEKVRRIDEKSDGKEDFSLTTSPSGCSGERRDRQWLPPCYR